MIDEKKLIDQIKGMSDTCNLFRWRSPKKIKDEITSIIAHEPKIGEWIPCAERLPEESLNSVIGWDEHRQRCCFVQYYGGRWILGDDVDVVKIIAWQPLPAPYKPQ